MGYPSFDYVVWRFVVAQSLDQNVSAAVELATKDAVWTVSLIQRPAAVLHRCAEMLCSVLVFEKLDPVAIRACKQEPDHHVDEATVDEIVHDRA